MKVKQMAHKVPDTSQLPKGYSLLPEGTVIRNGDMVNFSRHSKERWIFAQSRVGTKSDSRCFAARQSEESRHKAEAEIKEKQLRFDPKFKDQNYGSW